MALNLTYSAGQTPIDPDEQADLLIPAITSREQLDAVEQHNIEEAVLWSVTNTFKRDRIFSEAFICDVHKRMFGDVWDRAGRFRRTDKNIGVDKWQISTRLRQLSDDARFWTVNKTFPPDQIALRFKHLLVSIHCFPNGNGRHSRLMADIIAEHIFRQPVFSWGTARKQQADERRQVYLTALREADKGSYESLVKFARS